MNQYCHAAYDHAENYINLCTDPVHMVEILKIAFGKSWKLQRMGSMRNDVEVGL